MSAQKPKSYTPTQLMALCRADGRGGGWEPEAIEQWRWQLLNAEGPEQCLAWVKLNSVAKGSPCCVDKPGGKPLRVEHMAAELGIALKTAQNHCTMLVTQGRIRLKKQSVWYRADVPEKDAGEDLKNSRVHGNFPAYLVDFIESLSPEKQAAMAAAKERFDAWKAEVLNEGVAGIRAEIARVELIMFRGFGAPKISLRPAERAKPRWVQLDLLSAPDFVHGNSTETQNKAKPGSVHGTPSLLLPDSSPDSSSDNKKKPTSSSSLPAAAQPDDDAARAFLEAECKIDEGAARMLLRECRERAPLITARDVLRFWKKKAGQLSGKRNADNFVGLMLKSVAVMVSPASLDELRAEADKETLDRWTKAPSWSDSAIRREARDALADSNSSPAVRTMARQILEHETQKGKGHHG